MFRRRMTLGLGRMAAYYRSPAVQAVEYVRKQFSVDRIAWLCADDSRTEPECKLNRSTAERARTAKHRSRRPSSDSSAMTNGPCAKSPTVTRPPTQAN